MQQQRRQTRRHPGAGHLFTKTDTAGRESWYAKWYSDGRQLKRKVGPKRDRSGRGLDRREAEAKLTKMISEATAPPPSSRVDVAEAGRRLIEHLELQGRKPATIEAYESLLRIHLTPAFEGRSLGSIETEDVEAFVRSRTRAGKSAKTIRNALGLLHSIYVYAQKQRWATSNPCTHADKPTVPDEPEIRFLDDAELEAAIRAEAEVGDDLSPVLALMYRAAGMTGLRQGELIALRWRDLDWQAGRVRVRRSYVRGEFGTPKSRRGSRSVPLADELAGLLDAHHRATDHGADDDLVFGHPASGRPLDRSKVRKRFKAALRRGGVREVRFHDLRHTFGTRMAGVGVPMRTLQEWMGHRDFATTLIYADYSPSEREREWIEAAFAQGAPNERRTPRLSGQRGAAVDPAV